MGPVAGVEGVGLARRGLDPVREAHVVPRWVLLLQEVGGQNPKSKGLGSLNLRVWVPKHKGKL